MAIATGRSAYIEGIGGAGKTAPPWTREREGWQDAGAPILDTCVTTSQRRKLGRLYRRLTEVEYLTPELLTSACFITLTSAKPLPAEDIRRGWHRVQAWLMRHGYTCYLVTSAVQGQRFEKYGDAVLHYHVAVLGHRRVPVQGLRATWALGATYHESAKNPQHAIRYMASYMKGNNGRLSWSYALLHRLPAGAAAHSNCFRYVRADHANGFPGGIINFGWGHVHAVNEVMGYVPALGRIVPLDATSNHSLLWTCYRLCIDWESARARIRDKVREENTFIERFRRESFSDSENPSCFPTGSSNLDAKGGSHAGARR